MSDPELKVAIVTGASSGIGKASAIALAKAGWSVVLFARRAEKLKETQEQCPRPDHVLVVEGDVTNEKDVVRLFEESVKRFGRVDMLFNNAGMSHKATPIEDMTLETFQSVVNANLIGPFLCTREAFKVFKSQLPQGGRIINNGSIAAHAPRPYATAYTTTKHAITGLTKSTSMDGRRHNITCTQIDIGNADTEMAAGQKAGVLQPDWTIKPEATFDVKHVANAIVHIASLPLDVTVLNFNIMATLMPWIGRG